MLKTITIKDFAIISALGLSFEPGLNIFTGETGAGKSIVIEALGFALGARGDAGLLRAGAAKMVVEAGFNAATLPGDIRQKYKITGPDFTIRRELDAKGKSRAWVNNQPVLMADLAALGDILVDFHGQHEHQTLFKPAAHLDILDAYANLGPQLKAYGVVYAQVKDLEAKLATLHLSAGERERALELYKYQLEEIEKLAPQPGEDDAIEAALPRLKNAAKLKDAARQAHELLDSAPLAKAAHLLANMAGFDASLAPAASEIEAAASCAQEIALTLADYAQNIDGDDKTLDDMLSRQEVLRKLKLKYGPALSDVLARGESLKKQMAGLEGGGQSAQKLEAELANLGKKLLSLSEALFAARQKAAAQLAARVVAEIRPLGFEQVRFEAALEHGLQPGPKGADSAEFLFSPNPGSALRPLRNIASGGEISRLMLGLKTVLNSGTPVMVFDEVDAGISGHTGKLVGRKLKAAAEGRQVLCVTHLPQVAAHADKHFSVAKFAKNGQTEVRVDALTREGAEAEIARMIGAGEGKTAGRQHAKDLLQEAKK